MLYTAYLDQSHLRRFAGLRSPLLRRWLIAGGIGLAATLLPFALLAHNDFGPAFLPGLAVWLAGAGFLLHAVLRPVRRAITALSAAEVAEPAEAETAGDEIGALFAAGRRRARQVAALRQELDRAQANATALAGLLSENPTPVLRVTPDGAAIYANQAAYRVSALWADGRWRQLSERVRPALATCWRQRQPETLHIDVGDARLTLFLTPIVDGGYINIHAAGDAAAAADGASERIPAAMGHDIRTAMNSVIGMAGLLQATDLDEDQHTMVASLCNAAEGLLTLVAAPPDELGFGPAADGPDTTELQARQAVASEGEQLAMSPAPDRPDADKPRPLRILIVEDNPVNQQVTRRLLRSLGHNTDAVENGREAVMAVMEQPYDLVLMDIQMPEMDGLEATRHIRALPPPAGTLPIMALTAALGPEIREACADVGMTDFVAKPLDPATLVAALARVEGAAPATAPAAAPAPAPEPVAEDVFDAACLDDLRDVIGDDGVMVALEQLAEDAAERLARMTANRDQAAELGRDAHSLKSAAAGLGLAGLSRCMAAVEQAARAGDQIDWNAAEAERLLHAGLAAAKARLAAA